ncbi:hypothetical protein SAMN05660742_12920 [Propionispira arboris]|uniref:Uncharacterized protein n=1 Tax=Propionispira arboris TaxID=84035 RepID=A0A1H7DA29_9FIRM|nr:hypothetical protein [Propionispira arboris]SEJ96030.1 hypothetical protein SAMN05660742_12920 [Propionispira arboris]
MSFISIKEIRTFCQQYTCETLTSNPKNKDAILSFTTTEYGEPLVNYLQNDAWKHDEDGKTKVYLIKDSKDEIAFYFSLKCGLLYKKEMELDQEKEYYVDSIYKIMENTTDTSQHELDGLYTDVLATFDVKGATELFNIARSRLEAKKDQERDPSKTTHVAECYPAIELMHYCKNTSYKGYKYTEVPLGFVLFWEVVVPQICRITETIGCEYVYLFAADKSDRSHHRLVDHYRNAYKFDSMTDAVVLKSDYETDCYTLTQDISALKENREGIWKERMEDYENDE